MPHGTYSNLASVLHRLCSAHLSTMQHRGGGKGETHDSSRAEATATAAAPAFSDMLCAEIAGQTYPRLFWIVLLLRPAYCPEVQLASGTQTLHQR